MSIGYSHQSINQDDVDAVVRVLRSDRLTQGEEVPLFEQALSKSDTRRRSNTQKKSFLKSMESAVRVLYKEGYLQDEDVHRVAMGCFIKVLTDPSHPSWWNSMKEYLARIYGKPAERVEHGIDKQLLEEIRLVPMRKTIAELPLLDNENGQKEAPPPQEEDGEAEGNKPQGT
jgi:hypothetical protein